jgi:hypothetical protein
VYIPRSGIAGYLCPPPPNSYVEILTSKVVLLGKGCLGDD